MRNQIFIILACLFTFPFIARSQNEGIKPVSNASFVEKAPMHARSTQQMSMIQDQGPTGGATMEPGIFSGNSSLFLEPGWASGRVLLKDQTLLDDVKLRYDIYHQQIQFIQGNDTLAFAKPDEVHCFMFAGRKFIYADYQSSGIIGKSYFEIMADGNCRLLLRRTIKYHMDPESVSNLEDEIFVRENEYFIEKRGEIARPVRACKKSVLCVFKDKEDEVKEFMQKNNMKVKTCDELMQVVAYYNTLP